MMELIRVFVVALLCSVLGTCALLAYSIKSESSEKFACVIDKNTEETSSSELPQMEMVSDDEEALVGAFACAEERIARKTIAVMFFE